MAADKCARTGAHTLSTLAKRIRIETGKTISRGNVHRILKNRFYVGSFEWMGHTYPGTHRLYVKPELFDQVQVVLTGHNRPKYSKREIAFRGLMQCAYDGCVLTGDIQREKYVYYRCTGHRGKCGLPRFREEDLAQRLGEPLKGLQVPQEIVSRIVTTLRKDQQQSVSKISAERSRLDARLTAIHKRLDSAYADKLDGKIPEDFWERKMSDCEWKNSSSRWRWTV